MAPVKKSKSVNKGFSFSVTPTKDNKLKHKKRKLSNMLGPQWSKHELERFYEAFRKYGQDWKKVSSSVRSRSIDMVEALYSMNQAYLSLPEGIASVAGLVAMMTDHYNARRASGGDRDRDRDRDAPPVITRKAQKYPKTKVRVESPRENSFQRQPAGSSDGCLCLLKMCRDGIQPYFPVKKRTPRLPVSSLDNHQNKSPRGSISNLNCDEASHGALSLTEERRTSSSAIVHEALYRDTKYLQNPARTKGHPKPLMEKSTNSGVAVNEESAGGSLGSGETKNGDPVWDSVDSGKSAFPELKRRKKGKEEEVEHTEAKVFDGVRLVYNIAERGQSGKVSSEDASPIMLRSTHEVQRRNNKKLMFEDERAACDALQTLAEMSLMMPYLASDAVEIENGEKFLERDSIPGRSTHSDVTLKDDDRVSKKKRKSETSKTSADEEMKSADSGGHISNVSRRPRSAIRTPDVSCSNDQPLDEVNFSVSSTREYPDCQAVNPSRRKNKRKRHRTLLLMDRKHVSGACSSENSSSVPDGVQSVKGKISHCLSWNDVRRWCLYEWFYSAIDYPWFAKKEFVEYLDHVGLGHIPRLTRVEWGVIRSSLGKPRRLSERFLLEEREKLKQYRESVRTHYANLRAGLGEGLPPDLARPLSVGQQVVAIHPKTREFHNGIILTVDHHNCLVQFDCPDLGVELVMDIECMPLKRVENMPEVLRRQVFDSWYTREPKVKGALMVASEEHMKNMVSHFPIPSFNSSISNEKKVKRASTSLATITGSGSFRVSSASQSRCNIGHVTHMLPRKDDVSPVPGVIQSLDRKALEQLNVCPGNQLCWSQPVLESVDLNGTLHSSNNTTFNCQATASNVAEVVEGSRDKARRMVDTAIKVMSLVKEGEDAFGRIGEALNAPDKAEPATNCRASMLTPSNMMQGLPHQGRYIPSNSKTGLAGDTSGMKAADGPSESSLQVPSNLISSCVATLLMIQTCTERQFPPAEVAQILDNAVTSLHPCCSQNHSIYREIQMCMGRIKTQILALVPM